MQHTCIDRLLADISELDDAAGFVIAPFHGDDSCATVLVEPEEKTAYASPEEIPGAQQAVFDACSRGNAINDIAPATSREDYARDFERFHVCLVDRHFQKLVLARDKTIPLPSAASPIRMFAKACRDYPRLFVALYSSPVCGTWLVATPEVLIERDGDRCRTMALAGTMRYEGDMHPRWSQKNIMEQACVESYIHDAIAPLAETLDQTDPYTVRAADLVHLRTDYDFTAANDTTISSLISALHPTPAVCGLPRAEALEFIMKNEHSRRGYYSGYCGPVGIDGATRLFVSLRCMRIDKDTCRLYAGGGLLDASEEENEWRETENKMQTMQRCING